MSKIYVDEIAGIASADTVAIPGHVIQVVSNTINTRVDFTSSSYTSMGLSVAITPKSATSTLYVKCTSTAAYFAGAATVGFIFRRSDGVYSPLSAGGHGNINTPNGATMIVYGGSTGATNNNCHPFTMEWFDSTHNTTSEITYEVYGANNSGSSSTSMGGIGNSSGYEAISTISIMEIAG